MNYIVISANYPYSFQNFTIECFRVIGVNKRKLQSKEKLKKHNI